MESEPCPDKNTFQKDVKKTYGKSKFWNVISIHCWFLDITIPCIIAADICIYCLLVFVSKYK